MKRITFLVMLLSCNLSLFAQDNSFIKNFPPNVYRASPTVYNITMDHQGILYFGTNNGVVVFDGARWELINISNFSEVKTLEVGPDSLVYVGANGNFGYLESDPIRGLKYVSISDSLPPYATNFNDIWQIVFIKEKVFFQSYAGIFTWDGKFTQFDKIKDVYIFSIKDQLYGSNLNTGEFGKIVDGTIKAITPFPDITNDLVFQVFDHQDSEILLATSEHGLYLFNSITHETTKFQSAFNKVIVEHNFYDGLKLDKNNYAMGTWRDGIYFLNSVGNIINILNDKNGLYANHIYDMKADKRNNLWLATSYGISKIFLDSLGIKLHNVTTELSKPIIRSINFSSGNQNLKLPLSEKPKTVITQDYTLRENMLEIWTLPSSLSMYFALPEFAGDDISYSLFLQGYDNDWSEWKPEAVKEYTNLPGGDYNFQIKGKNDLTGELSDVSSFEIKIYTPWYQSNWTKVIILLLFLLIVYIMVRLMIIRLKTQNTRLENIVNERTRDLVEQQQKLSNLNKSLSSTNKELDSFVYHTSHDLKAPLKSVLGLVNLAKYDDPKKEFFVYHDRIESSIHKLEEFISSIIQYSTNSNSRIEPVEIDFNLLVDNSISELQYHEDFDKIKISKNIKTDGSFVSDEKRIQIILNNLLSNAIKYYDLSKTEQRVNIDITLADNKIKMIIEDNGVGINEEYQERVFTMFYRASEKSYGSGLGLYIIKETVKKLGGTISMESAENQFTRFTIELPNQKSTVLA